MKFKASTICLLIFNLLAVIYLLLPTPQLKDLDSSVRSQEPGDTVQMVNVTGHYTNLSRREVMNFYRSFYSGPFMIRLNYPPEYAKTIFRDTMQSYYLEEFHLPFKESLFINGYEWAEDVFTKPENRIQNKLLYHDIEYRAKINTKIIPTSIPARFLAFFITEIAIIFVIFLYKKFWRQNFA